MQEDVPESYIFISYEGKQFIKQGEGVYKNEQDYVYYKIIDKKTEITMTFSDVIIYINPPKDPEVKFPDGCSMYVTKNGIYGENLPSGHYHDFPSYASLTYQQVTNPSSVEYEVRKVQVAFLIALIIIIIVLSFFVFNIDNIYRIKIWKNSLIPMHREPYEPSKLNVGLNYVAILIVYFMVIYYIIKILIDIF